MKTIALIIILFSQSGCASKLLNHRVANDLQPHVDSIAINYAPDKRIIVFDVQAEGHVLKGETSSSIAKSALIKELQNANKLYVDSIIVLPGASLDGKTKAVVSISVANLRTQPSHKAELASQATLGTPLKVWKRERNWYLVQTPDQYIAWVDAEGITRMDSITLHEWQNQTKTIYTKPFGFAYTSDLCTETICDLVYGNIMAAISTSNGFTQVMLPDGRTGIVRETECQPYDEWKNTRMPSTENLVRSAKQLMGVPYLWGGTSFKGVDCSGFTKTVYFMNGLVLPRDASQQVNLGEEIDTKSGWKNLQPGDMLFFGNHAAGNLPERVVHVGMWIGDNEFIHASGRVQVSSLDPNAANYNEHEHRRFLRAKRISPEMTLIDLRRKDLL